MKIRPSLTGLAAFLLFALTALSVRAAEYDWRWVVTQHGGADAWVTEQGSSPMEIHGRTFHITLQQPNPQGADLRLDGVVNGDRVVVRATRLGTDASPEVYRGRIRRDRTPRASPANGWGEDLIWLTDGANFIGLSRAVRAGGPEAFR